MIELHHNDCLEITPQLETNSIDLILTDPPYYKVKYLEWDRQWMTQDEYLDWMRELCREWRRLLKPNGSLYVFASPQRAARVELVIGESFNVLNSIRWVKDAGWHKRAAKEEGRSYYSPWEAIIFADQYGVDNYAKGEAGYGTEHDELRGFVFEPLRAYLDNERRRADVSFEDVRQIVSCAPGSGLPSHWFTRSQWILPTQANYEKLRVGFHSHNHGGEYLQREYEDLRREYEDLQRDYEDLRRPFSVTADVPYTDTWTFPTVQAYPGKHPCEKPAPLLEHIIKVSSRKGTTVADFFTGSGSTGVAAVRLNRNFIGIERDAHWFYITEQNVTRAQNEMVQLEF